MKHFLYLIFVGICSLSYAQTKAYEYYNMGLEAFKTENYTKADSLLNIAASLQPDKDTYYLRALCQGKLANKHNYCSDLVQASLLHSERAQKLFNKTCGSIDTTFIPLVDTENKPMNIVSRAVEFKGKDTVYFAMFQKYYSQISQTHGSLSSQVISANDSEVATMVEQRAEFPGGIQAMTNFIIKNLKPPKQLYRSNNSYKVTLKFTVFEDGTLHDITYVQRAEGCPDCDEEATRIIATMPKWTPAIINGKFVKCYFNIPILFRVNK